MILSVSSISVGMKRSAMLIIMDISCTGTFSFFSGLKSDSMPSVRAMGAVVYVSRKVPKISSVMRSTINTARTAPSRVTVTGPSFRSGVPVVKNRFRIAVKMMMIITGLSPRSSAFGGMRLTATARIVTVITSA